MNIFKTKNVIQNLGESVLDLITHRFKGRFAIILLIDSPEEIVSFVGQNGFTKKDVKYIRKNIDQGIDLIEKDILQ